MWFLSVQTVPKPNAINTSGFSSALVQCWINFPLLDGAEQLVKYYLDKEGWQVISVEFYQEVKIENYREIDEGYEYAHKAHTAGASFLFQTDLA